MVLGFFTMHRITAGDGREEGRGKRKGERGKRACFTFIVTRKIAAGF